MFDIFFENMEIRGGIKTSRHDVVSFGTYKCSFFWKWLNSDHFIISIVVVVVVIIF